MSDVYKLQYNGMTIAYPGWNGYVGYEQLGYPITYLSDEHVSLTGDVQIYIPGSEGITLDSGYDTYYRISGYDITGGSIVDGKLVPTGPCTIKAVEKANYFTATGGWEQGSNVEAYGGYYSTTANLAQKYATAAYKTDNVPQAWYSNSNRWSPNGASAYEIVLNPNLKFSAHNGSTRNSTLLVTGQTLIGSNSINTAAYSSPFGRQGGTTTINYNKALTSTAQDTCSLSGRFGFNGQYGYVYYIATGTTGTWTATGIAP